MHREFWREQLHDYIDFLKVKYKLSEEEIKKELLSVQIPAGIYNCQNTPFQTTIVYLIDFLGQNFKQAAETLSKTNQEINQAYKKANKKIGFLKGPGISTAILNQEGLTISESIVFELTKKGMTVEEITALIGRNPQTIYALQRRAKLKKEGGLK